jgi:hypothetical protein
VRATVTVPPSGVPETPFAVIGAVAVIETTSPPDAIEIVIAPVSATPETPLTRIGDTPVAEVTVSPEFRMFSGPD